MKMVGFAGIGTMGSGMVRNLLKHGFQVFVYNRTKAKATAINGATIVDTPAALCKKADVLFTCVSNDAALQEILFSTHGVFSQLTPRHILIDCSTTSISLTQDIVEQCNAKGTAFLDAPLTGSKTGAEQGTLMFMVGGEK